MVDDATVLPGGMVRTAAALAGLTYTIDVLRLIPYANVQLGVIHFGGAVVKPKTVFAAELGIGADYFVSRRWTTGVSFQYLFAPADLISDPLNLGSSPFSFSATWRVSRIFWVRGLPAARFAGAGSFFLEDRGWGLALRGMGAENERGRASRRSRRPCAAG